ncbi:LysR family transcriptional regulator [Psychrobium sp. MM17-31]|uniref:LysR family transcriptional regulator n=1 Tax=Psychrobium sp. MM17-31 TaxID=2917758 RepID=UPI001EF5347D|nr:LysR family transcriptional regulator [Psychrobium sp. MM17-31]MCG7531102.1 LysR family transcriptional regulator [Psychrobium sp. MM17-31]
MNVTLKQLKAFVVVAQQESFMAACELLHISQPALSIAIKNLETEVGGALFSRTTRAVVLTPEGQRFLPTAKRLLQDWDDAFIDLSQAFTLEHGILSIAAMPSFASSLVPSYLKRFRNEFPDVKIKLHDVVAEDAVQMVIDDQVELALVFEVPDVPQLDFIPLFEDKFVAAIPPALAQDCTEHFSWAQLLESPLIALQQPSTIRAQIEALLDEQGLAFDVEFEANQLATIGQMVASGLGVSAVPSLCTPLFEAQGAKCVPLQSPPLMRRVGIVTQQRKPLSVAAQSFIGQLVEKYG